LESLTNVFKSDEQEEPTLQYALLLLRLGPRSNNQIFRYVQRSEGSLAPASSISIQQLPSLKKTKTVP
jgi:hypothetical protein